MMSLSTRTCSVTIDAVQQKIYFVTHWSLFARPRATRVVSFEEIKQVYLDCREESYTVQEEYYSQERTRRTWAIELALRDGQIVTVEEETTDHRAGETTALAQQHARWEPLATTVSDLVGKPLARMPGAPGGPHTFVEGIEFLLQRRLKQSGLCNLSVHIRSGKDLRVEIVVSGKSYAAVDEVEDAAVRELIQDSIHEWQDSTKG